jgi:hypothetical protein
MNKETNDQIAAIMLLHGTPDQQKEAILYCSRDEVVKDKESLKLVGGNMDKKMIKKLKEQHLLAKDFEWNDGYYLEGMDRVHTIQVMISEILDQHPMIVLSNNQEKLEKIQRKLTEIYQSIGAMEYDKKD